MYQDEEELTSEITRELINTLPSLIAKQQTDESRIANVLLIPELMNIDLYLDMRMITVCITIFIFSAMDSHSVHTGI